MVWKIYEILFSNSPYDVRNSAILTSFVCLIMIHNLEFQNFDNRDALELKYILNSSGMGGRNRQNPRAA